MENFGRTALNWYLIAAFGIWTGASSAEKVELTTAYPSPSGVYTQIVTTGGSGRNTLLCRDSGNVGIGVIDPKKKLDVKGSGGFTDEVSAGSIESEGTVQVGNLSADPPGSNGMIYYNTARKDFRAFINGQWRALCCVSDGSCTAGEPACGTTTTGEDNCGGQCTRTGPACCVATVCTAATPTCGKTTTGMNNCGEQCTKVGEACLYKCPEAPRCFCSGNQCKGQITTSPTCRMVTTGGCHGWGCCGACGGGGGGIKTCTKITP